MIKKVTILWPLPPWKWISEYVYWFTKVLSQHTDVQVLDFLQMYPSSFYPWWNPKQIEHNHDILRNIDHVSLLCRRNPISWIRAWKAISWEILHMQYWIRFLAPVYVVVWLYARYIKKIPVIITIHNVKHHEHTRWKGMIDKIVFAVADTYIVHTEIWKKQLEKICWMKKKIHVFPHWIITPVCPKINKNEARKVFSLSEKDKLLLFFWHIRPYKWLKVLLNTLSSLIKNDATYRLIIAWSCRENRNEYDRLIRELKLENHITRIDWFLSNEKVAQVFSASDILVLPYSHFDAQSGVVALGFGYEIPMIVSDLWWLRAVIDDDTYFFPVWNIVALEQKILNINLHDAKTYICQRKLLFSREHIVIEYSNTILY